MLSGGHVFAYCLHLSRREQCVRAVCSFYRSHLQSAVNVRPAHYCRVCSECRPHSYGNRRLYRSYLYSLKIICTFYRSDVVEGVSETVFAPSQILQSYIRQHVGQLLSYFSLKEGVSRLVIAYQIRQVDDFKFVYIVLYGYYRSAEEVKSSIHHHLACRNLIGQRSAWIYLHLYSAVRTLFQFRSHVFSRYVDWLACGRAVSEAESIYSFFRFLVASTSR